MVYFTSVCNHCGCFSVLGICSCSQLLQGHLFCGWAYVWHCMLKRFIPPTNAFASPTSLLKNSPVMVMRVPPSGLPIVGWIDVMSAGNIDQCTPVNVCQSTLIHNSCSYSRTPGIQCSVYCLPFILSMLNGCICLCSSDFSFNDN